MKAVIIGGGIAGVALSRNLAKAGVAVTVIERGPQLCSGATWHAAGLVTRFAGSPKLKKVHVRAMQILNEMQDDALAEGEDIGLHRPGSIRLIEKGSRDRYIEAMQHVAMAKIYDTQAPELDTVVVSPDEIQELHPLVDTSNIECGIWTQHDGYIDPTMLTTHVGKQAKALGAEIRLATECIEVNQHAPGKGFEVHTRAAGAEDGGEVTVEDYDILVNAAGLWCKSFTEDIMGLPATDHPAQVIQHQYVITDTLPEIKARMAAGDGRLPVLRDLAGSSYIRQERDGILIGPYEAGMVVAPWPDAPPASFQFELFQGDLERIEDHLMAAYELVPALNQAGIINVTNGPTIWTPDGSPRVGPTRIAGYYDFNTLNYGITHGLPLAEYLSAVITTGEQPQGWDLTEFYPTRYQDWTTSEYVTAKVLETYVHNNKVNYGGFENRGAGREFIPQNPIVATLEEDGAEFGIGLAGMEHPLFYKDGATWTGSDPVNFAKFTHHEWEETAEAEAATVLENVGLSYGLFSTFRVHGPGAQERLSFLTTAPLPKNVGQSKLTYALNESGLIMAEFTVCRLGDDDFYVAGSRDAMNQDLRLLNDGPADPTVTNCSPEVEIVHIAGPNSYKVLEKLNPEVLEIPFLNMREMEIAGVHCKLFRISFSGCLGYELHCSVDDCPKLYSAIAEAGEEFQMGRFGSYALNSLRIEKAFKLKGDLDYAHYSEADINMFVAKKKDFRGKNPDAVPSRKSVTFTVDAEKGYAWSLLGDSPVHRKSDGELVGFTTTSAHGAMSQQTVALGYLTDMAITEDDALYVSSFDKQWDVKTHFRPLAPVLGRANPWEQEPA